MKTNRSGFTPMDRRGHPSGFTLLELMVGILIVSILAIIAIPNFSKAIEKTKVKEAQSTLSALYSAEKIYRLDQGSYGTESNLLDNNYISNPNASNTTWVFSTTNVSATAFRAIATRAKEGPNPLATIQVDETFTGDINYNGRKYDGNHPLRD